MKKLNKRILSLFVCFTLLLGIVIPNYVNADDKITIDLKTSPKIDIVLTSNISQHDLSNFKKDIINKFKNTNIDTNNINIQTVNRANISTSSTDAKTIFETWTQFPFNSNNGWYYNESTKSIICPNDAPGETGFFNTQKIGNFKMTSKILAPELNQPIGFVYRITKDAKTGRYSMYWLWVSGDRFVNGYLKRAIAIFKTEGYNMDALNRIGTKGYYAPNSSNVWENYSFGYTTGGAYAATPQERCGPYEWSNHLCGGYPAHIPTTNGSVAINMADENLKTTTLGTWDINTINYYNKNYAWTIPKDNTPYLLTLEAKGNNFKVYYNNSLIIDCNDIYGTPIYSGYVGVFSFSHPNTNFYNVDLEMEIVNNYTDILYKPNWREDADHFIVNVDEVIDESFTNPTSMGEILTRTINDDINFIQWGSVTNKNVMENFITQNNGNGTFINGDNYENALNKTVEYIANQYKFEESNDQYVIVNTPTDLEVNPIELATNTKDEEYPNGKWIIHHNAKYFANGTGQSEYSEQYQDNLNIVFDKPGEYTIYYGEDLVKTIYAHRKPIANFTMSLNSDKTLNIVNSSYDLDSNVNTNGLGNGIASATWQWKNINDSEWQDGVPTSALTSGESYVVQLSVVDEQGVESTPTSKYITLDADVKIPPIAAFSYGNSTIFTNNELEIINTSYDPAGNAITGYSWVLKKAGKTISTSSTPTLKFDTSTLGAGEYSYTLTVTNSLGLTSEGYTKSFTVIDDTVAPSVMIDPTYSDWGDSSAINFEFMDSGSGFAKFRYTHSDTQTPPSDSDTSWSAWSTSDNGSLTIEEDGVWYLHIQAQDNNGNILNRTVGVYRIDTTNPVIESVSIDESSVEREIPITVVANDATSGLKKNAYRFVNESTGEDSGYIDSNVYNAKSNGVYTIYVKDQNNNEVSIQTREITFVDRVAPEILTFSTSTDQWTTSVDTIISAKDTFSGMNTYSYALEKVDESSSSSNKNNEVASINLFSTNVYAQDLSDVELIPIDVDNLDMDSLSWQEDDTFNITENGTYNLYARDNANNVSAVQFTIGNIDKVAPTIEKIEKSTNEVTNGNVTITIVGASDESVGLHETPYSYDNGNTWTNVNTFIVSGNVNSNVLVRDALENTSSFDYVVDNIDKILPSIEDFNIINNREEKKSNITFSVTDDRELYGYVLKNGSSLPSESDYVTSFEIDENGNVSDEVELTQNGTYYLFIKDKAGNIYSQKVIVDALVTGIDITQNQVTEYQEVGDNASSIALFNVKNNVSTEGAYDTMVYVSQETTFSVVIPKVIILDGTTGKADYQTSVIGNIAGVETIGVIPNDTFNLNDVANVKKPIVANVSQEKTSFGYSEIINKTTTNGSINAPNISAGSWKGTFNFNILVQNNQNTINSIASVPSDSFALVVDSNAINIPSND